MPHSSPGAHTADGTAGGSGTAWTARRPARRPATVFQGTTRIDPARPTPAFTRLNQEVLTHLLSQPDTEAEIRLEVEIRKTGGFPDHIIRTITENTRTLRFDEGTGFTEA